MVALDISRALRGDRSLLVSWAVVSTLLNLLFLLRPSSDRSPNACTPQPSSLRPLIRVIETTQSSDEIQSEAECWRRQSFPDSLIQAATNQDKTSHDPWLLMKAIPPPAPCTVQGLRIEQLEPHLNFRRPYALRHVSSEEDRSHVLPFLRAVQDPEMARRPRRVYLDLGGKEFASSAEWMLRWYPVDFTEAYVFEVKKGLFQLPSRQEQDEEALYPGLQPHKRSNKLSLFWRGKQQGGEDGPPPIPNWQLDRFQVFNDYVDSSDQHKHVNITRFIRDRLKLTAADTLVVKMDVEGKEWDVLTAWMADPAMPRIVDEIFVEVHYSHPSVLGFGWRPFNHTRDEATQLLVDLRARGFFVHAWP